MGDWLPTIVIAIIALFIIRWFAGDSSANSGNANQGIPGITPATVENLHSAFPDIPIPNLIYSLSKTRSAQRTSEEIIEKGYLAAPPATYRPPIALLPPSVNPPSVPGSPIAARTQGTATSTTSKPSSNSTPSLIDRYSLSSRLSSLAASEVDSGSESDGSAALPGLHAKGGQGVSPGQGSGLVWADSKEAREKGLRERKEKMILEARRMLEKQKAAQQSGTSTPGAVA